MKKQTNNTPVTVKNRNEEPRIDFKPRWQIVLCATLVCALIGLFISAVLLKKDVVSTAQVSLELKDRANLLQNSADVEKNIDLYRGISESLDGEVSVRQIRQNVSFTDDEAAERKLVSDVTAVSGADGSLSVSFVINEPGADVPADSATVTTDRDGNRVVSFKVNNVNSKVVITAKGDSAEKAKKLATEVALQLAKELYGEREDADACYAVSEAAILSRDVKTWPSIGGWTLLFGLLALLISFLVCFTLPAIRKQFLLKGWQKLLIVVLCTAITGVCAYVFCEKVAKPRYTDTLMSTLSVDEGGETKLLEVKGDAFGEKDYNILNAFDSSIGAKVRRPDRSDFYLGVYEKVRAVDESVERPGSGLKDAIEQTVDENTRAVVFTIRASDDLKAERIATACVNQLAEMIFGAPETDKQAENADETAEAQADEAQGDSLSMRVVLNDPEPDNAELHLYECLINGQSASDEQISLSVKKVEADSRTEAAGNVQWQGVLFVSEQNVMNQLPAAQTVKYFGRKLDLYDGVSSILASDAVYEETAAELSAYHLSGSEIRNMTALSTSASNRVLSLSATCEDAQQAADVVTALTGCVAAKMFEGIEYADMYYTVTTPTITRSQVLEWPATITWVIVSVLIALLASYMIFAQQHIADSLIVVFFVLFTILCVFPFYYLFINTISNNELVAGGRINFFPSGLHINNYLRIFKEDDVGQALKITVLRTLLGTALMVLTSAWAGYLVTKQKMWKRSLWYRALVVTMYFNAGLIPWYTNMLMLGLTNNFLAYLIPGMVAPYNIILVKTYIESIPGSLEESAIIDGASTTKVFARIILPLSIPILATIAIFGAVGNWNSFQDSLLLMSSSPRLYTLQHRLYIYLNQTTSINTEQLTTQQAKSLLNTGVTTKYTIAMVTIIPILLVYPFMQRFFVKGIMLGAVKG